MNNNSIADETIPTQFFLSQNYPNPFNEKTLIKYCVPLKTKVHIAIYNTHGEMLTILVNEIKNPGTYETEINIANQQGADECRLPDGYYFYKMITEEFSSEKKWFCINHLFGRLNMKSLIQTLFFFFLTTQICFGQWTQVGLNSESIQDIAVKDNKIFAVTADSGKLFRSTDNGVSWILIVDSLATDVAISTTGKVFMVKDYSLNWYYYDSLYSSTNDGDTWRQVNIKEQLEDSISYKTHIMRLVNNPGGTIFCGIDEDDGHIAMQTFIARSGDDGITWITPGRGVIGGNAFDFKNQSVITIGTKAAMYWGTYSYIHFSTDYGNTWNFLGTDWQPIDIKGASLIGLFSNGNIIVGGECRDSSWWPTFPAILISTDMCSTWTKISSLNSRVGLSVSIGSTERMLVGTDSLGVFLFSDEGDSLGSRNEGLTNLNVQTLTLDNNGYVYAGTENGVWRRPLSEIVTSIEQEPTQPTEFILEQNYPNPFNPSTTINWQSPVGNHQTIKVYDVLGNEIATLVDEYKPAGRYELEFNAATLPSGVYFYQLKVGDFLQTRKMILLK